MKEAIKNLNEWLIEFVESLQFEKILQLFKSYQI